MNIIEGYKGFNSDLRCHDFQYEIGKTYTIEGEIKICEKGFHFCENPVHVLNFYPLIFTDGTLTRFAKVKGFGIIEQDLNKNCASDISIIEEISFSDFINIIYDYNKKLYLDNDRNQIKDIFNWGSLSIPEKYEKNKCVVINLTSGYFSIISTNTHVHINHFLGAETPIDSSFDYSNINLFTSGNTCELTLVGKYTNVFSSGEKLRVTSSNLKAMIFSTGKYADIKSGGNRSTICSTGDLAEIYSNGSYDQIYSSGWYSYINCTGQSTKIFSSGYNATIISSGSYNMVSSNSTSASIVCTGIDTKVRAKKGSSITLTEYNKIKEVEFFVPVNVKTEIVDGERIKEDTFYKLVDGKFTEVD